MIYFARKRLMIYYIIGVSGSGKTTVGQLLSSKLNIPFFDADDFHPPQNVAKMAAGQALDDTDRAAWLQSLNDKARAQVANKEGAIIACSGLKERYRSALMQHIEPYCQWVHLKGSYELIFDRMKQRVNHYMPASLLKSQFEALEEPNYGLSLSIEQSETEIVNEILAHLVPKKEFGLVGLGVMGKSLARNLASKGFELALYNRYVKDKEESVAENFVKEHAELKNCYGFEQLRAFVDSLASPKKIFLMVNAGAATEAVINELKPLLAAGDIIIDGGNTHYTDTERRQADLEQSGIYFIGTGVSGGEEGALKGPSIMPGGAAEAYHMVAPYLLAIAAKDAYGQPCCTHVGEGGAGHFVKMVHNGIEYAEMQLLAEIYALFRFGNKLEPTQIAEIFDSWASTEAQSYLLEITAAILKVKEKGGAYLIDQILDKAGNKGTGSWTTVCMAEAGLPATLISSALFARYVSAFKEKRTAWTNHFGINQPAQHLVDRESVFQGYQLARKLNHYQGFELISYYSKEKNWGINLGELSRIWTNGCIIRSVLMEKIENFQFEKMDCTLLTEELSQLKTICMAGINFGLSIPCLLAAVDYLNAHLHNFPTANIIQAQRDYFGAHTFQRVNDDTGKYYHHHWV